MKKKVKKVEPKKNKTKKKERKIEKKWKKGLSSVVATLLIILLTLVAIAIIWVVIKNTLVINAEKISLDRLTLSLDIEGIRGNCNEVSVVVRRNTGEGHFVGLAFVLEGTSGSEVYKDYTSMSELETKEFKFNIDELNSEDIESIKIYPLFKLESGKEFIGSVKSEYKLSGYEIRCGTEPGCTISAPQALSAESITSSGFTARWNSVDTAERYYLDISENANFNSFINGFSNRNVGQNINQVVTGLSEDTNYYYRVRAYRTGCTSGNSNTITVKTDTEEPVIPAGYTGIYTLEDLYNIRNDDNGKYFLTRNLDFNDCDSYRDCNNKVSYTTGEGWVPIVSSGYVLFRGVFDGNGKTISNLYINRPSDNNVGLFGRLEGTSEIRDLGVLNVNVSGRGHTGGLVGWNGGEISNSYATGTVKETAGEDRVGGLVGYNSGDVLNSYASVSVTGNLWVGGLVGKSSGKIENSYSSSNVNGTSDGNIIGGLVGYNEGEVLSSYATGTVTGDWVVGGLVGYNSYSGEVLNSHATGVVTGNDYIGGLVGENANVIENSYATGNVNHAGQSEEGKFGGLVGYNYGEVFTSYATGSVSGSNHVGGLVGWNGGDISNSYATGSATGSSEIGGLVGRNDGGTVSKSYSVGRVTGGSSLGGLVGTRISGTISNSFYDKDTSGRTDTGRGTSKTTAEMKTIGTFTTLIPQSQNRWDMVVKSSWTNQIWYIEDGIDYPRLGFQYN